MPLARAKKRDFCFPEMLNKLCLPRTLVLSIFKSKIVDFIYIEILQTTFGIATYTDYFCILWPVSYLLQYLQLLLCEQKPVGRIYCKRTVIEQYFISFCPDNFHWKELLIEISLSLILTITVKYIHCGRTYGWQLVKNGNLCGRSLLLTYSFYRPQMTTSW